jgi:uncharacterized protein
VITREVTIEIIEYLDYFPSIAFYGPRQVGKTTLAKDIAAVYTKKKTHYFDLENENDLYTLRNNSHEFLTSLQDDLVILDEVQVYPPLFGTLRSVIDQHRVAGRFILLGSADITLVKGVSESLAGRIVQKEITPITLPEATKHDISMDDHWYKGGFPEPLLMTKEKMRAVWAENFISTYVYRDLNLLFDINLNAQVTQKLWSMLAHLHSDIENKAKLGRSLGMSGAAISKYIDYMEGAYLIRRLLPWHTNVGKRLVKSPKVYVRSTAILHYLLGIKDFLAFQSHPSIGASWEGYVVEQIAAALPEGVSIYYYRTHHGAEVDVVLVKGTTPIATVEIKYSNAPKVSRGLYECINDLATTQNFVVTPNARTITTSEGLKVLSLANLLSEHLPNIA